MAELHYPRVLLKISGEALAGDRGIGFDFETMDRIADEIAGLTGEAGQQLARTVAEHITAGVPTVPVAVTRDDVPAALVDRERRIFSEQAAASGKPANIIEKMVQGRIDKYYKEVTLLDQPWVRDDSKAIRDLVKAAGAGVSIRRFARFQIGQE